MKNRQNIHIFIDILLLVLIMSISLSGFITRHVQPGCGNYGHHNIFHGTCGKVPGIYMYGFTNLHKVLSILFIVILIIDICIHWKQISAFFSNRITTPFLRNILYVILLFMIIITVIPWIFHIFGCI